MGGMVTWNGALWLHSISELWTCLMSSVVSGQKANLGVESSINDIPW